MSNNAHYETALSLANETNPNYVEVLEKIQWAIDEGDVRAMYALATWYLHGRDGAVTKNYRKAIPLLRKAAKRGHPEACFDLAICFENGAGVAKNEHAAAEWYLKAALIGDIESLKAIGRMYYYGIGVAIDKKIAKIWWDWYDTMKHTTQI